MEKLKSVTILLVGILCISLSSIYTSKIGAEVEKSAKVSYKIFYSGNGGAPNWRIFSTTLSENKKEGERRLAIDLGPAGTLDSAHAFSQGVVKEKNGYVMYYGGYDGNNWRILRAISVDGINWLKQGVCLNLGTTGTFDSVHILYPYVLKEEGLYKMYYAAYDGNYWRIGYAVSADGVIFKERQPVLAMGTAGALDSDYVHTPVVIKQGSIYVMYYAGFGGTTPRAWRIMRATSADGINWIKQGLALDRGSNIEPDSNNLLCGSATYSGGLYTLWYWAQGTNWRILYAISENGIDWQKKGVILDLGPSRSLDSKGLVVPAVIAEKVGEKVQ
ncbi:MAG: hypothetical protein A2166_01555 [Omnitrophica WOR_2 bacterium RBG_13_41_10]|nr:MAG: hypothetical protein A2166_01555 [Omnitrophica WOR_2 bacterium RBG_13_41_10]